MRSMEFSGRTVDEAIFHGLNEMGLTIDEVEIETLQSETKGIFGLGSKMAVVRLTERETPVVPDMEQYKKHEHDGERPPRRDRRERDGRRAPREDGESREERDRRAAEEADARYGYSEELAKDLPAAIFLRELLEKMGVEARVLAANTEAGLRLRIDSESMGLLIGRRGETLDAIQYLARMVENKGTQGYKRVSINVGNYREKREAALQARAKKDAARVLRTGRSLTLEPMNPYERRIIHTAIQEIEGVTSYSTGVDLDRRVIIASENAPKNAHGDRRDNRRGRGGRGDRPRREPYVPDIAADREKKNDVAGVSLYGKIEVKKDAAEEASDTTEA